MSGQTPETVSSGGQTSGRTPATVSGGGDRVGRVPVWLHWRPDVGWTPETASIGGQTSGQTPETVSSGGQQSGQTPETVSSGGQTSGGRLRLLLVTARAKGKPLITASTGSQSGRAGSLWLPPLAANDQVGTPTQASKRRESHHQQQGGR